MNQTHQATLMDTAKMEWLTLIHMEELAKLTIMILICCQLVPSAGTVGIVFVS